MKHNVILIVTDQQRLDTMHYARAASPCRTPALDALAAESLCFTNAYTNAPVCTPARSALHTGLYPSVTGMCTTLYQHGCSAHEIADRPFLLSRRLQAAGYGCGYTGKWHLGMGRDKTASAEGRQLLERREAGYMGVEAYLHYGTLPTDVGFIGDDFPGHGNGGYGTELFQSYLRENGLTLELRDTYGTAILLVTHNLAVAAYMASRILVMRNGSTVEQGDRESLLRSQEPYTRQLLQAVPDLGGKRYV